VFSATFTEKKMEVFLSAEKMNRRKDEKNPWPSEDLANGVTVEK
jgi:hypothetical protein